MRRPKRDSIDSSMQMRHEQVLVLRMCIYEAYEFNELN